MVQSHIEEALGDAGVPDPDEPTSLWSKLVHTVEHDLHISPGSFTPDDPDWYVFIAKGVLERLAMGNAPFNQTPAEFDGMAEDARLVIVGDWGTGLPRARDVATHMHEAIDRALASHRQVHVLHLGDVYYSGLETEDQRRFLDLWPVTQEQADAGVTSWSLNGNHDMYSGGFGYFGTLLGDPRFKAQRSPDGRPTSFFRLRSPSWDFIGIDTAWDTDVTSAGQVAVLQDPQAQYVSDIAAGSSRKLVLFSHHQLVSVYDKADLGSVLPAKLAPVLNANRVTAWWWGHEHRAITYGAAAASATRGAWATAECPSCLIPTPRPAAPRPSPGAAHARYERTAKSGPGSVSQCSICSPTESRSHTSMTTGTSPAPRRLPSGPAVPVGLALVAPGQHLVGQFNAQAAWSHSRLHLGGEFRALRPPGRLGSPR